MMIFFGAILSFRSAINVSVRPLEDDGDISLFVKVGGRFPRHFDEPIHISNFRTFLENYR